jgi:flagellar hook-length control protein FliK
MEKGDAALLEDRRMNVAPIDPVPATARAADMLSGQGPDFGNLLDAALLQAPSAATGTTSVPGVETLIAGNAPVVARTIATDQTPSDTAQPAPTPLQVADADTPPNPSGLTAALPPAPANPGVAAPIMPATPVAGAIPSPEAAPVFVPTAELRTPRPLPESVVASVTDTLPDQGVLPDQQVPPPPTGVAAEPTAQAAPPVDQGRTQVVANQGVIAISTQVKQPAAQEEPDGPATVKGGDRKKEGGTKVASATAKSAPTDLPPPSAGVTQSAPSVAAPLVAPAAIHVANQNDTPPGRPGSSAKEGPTEIGASSASPATRVDTAETGAVHSQESGHDNLPSLLTSQISATPIGRPAMPTQPYAASPSSPVPAPAQQPVIAAQAGRIGRDMGVEIARQVASGRSEVLIRLDPADMGRIDVRLSFDGRGTLHAAMSADSPAALDLLRRDAGDLSRALADAGIRSDATSFRFDSRSSDGGQFAQHQGQSGSDARDQRGGGSSHHGGKDEADTGSGAPLYRQLRTSGRIDLMA